MNLQVLLFELLLAGFFAIACFRARANQYDPAPRLRDFFSLTNRLERLRRTKWQWCSMVLLLLIVRQQIGTPYVLEFTALAQMLVFFSLPTGANAPAPAIRG